jgi:hypothetical protein
MSPINLFIAKLNFTQADNALEALHQFAAERSLVISFIDWSWRDKTIDWLSHRVSLPKLSIDGALRAYSKHLSGVYSVILAWSITFTSVMFLLGMLGFGPKGIIPGTLAAAFQSVAYGGFTPASGIFATLTSLAMLGYFMRLQAGAGKVRSKSRAAHFQS